MARNNKIDMPQSSGGLTRYFGDYTSKIQISPIVALYGILLVVIVVIVLSQA